VSGRHVECAMYILRKDLWERYCVLMAWPMLALIDIDTPIVVMACPPKMPWSHILAQSSELSIQD